MSPRSIRSLIVAGLLAAAVIGYGSASYGSTGKFLLLGHGNSERKTTTVAMTGKGAALRLTSRSSSPPLTVTSSRLVQHLNVAEVGGKTAADLRGTATQYVVTPAAAADTTVSADVPLPPGRYMLSYNANLSASADIRCYIAFHNGGYVMLNYGLEDISVATATATSAVDVTAAESPIALTCTSFTGSNKINFNDTGSDVTYVTALPLNAIAGKMTAKANFRRSAQVRPESGNG
jgi:hypothetical protein